MYRINNVFSCVLKVVRLQSDIRNAVVNLFTIDHWYQTDCISGLLVLMFFTSIIVFLACYML